MRFKYSLIVPSVRRNSYAISLLSMACEIRVTTCFSRKLSLGLSGRGTVFGRRHVGQILPPPSLRNSTPHRKQFRTMLTDCISIVLTKDTLLSSTVHMNVRDSPSNLIAICIFMNINGLCSLKMQRHPFYTVKKCWRIAFVPVESRAC